MLVFCCCFFQCFSPQFKNTSIWHSVKQMHSDQVAFWRWGMWAKATCDMYAQQMIIRLSWMHSYIYSTERLSGVGKLLVYCSQIMNASHLSACVHCIQSMFVDMHMGVRRPARGQAISLYLKNQFNAVNNVQNYQVNPVILKTAFDTVHCISWESNMFSWQKKENKTYKLSTMCKL